MRSLTSENGAATEVIVLHNLFVLLVKCLVVRQRCGSKSQGTPSRVTALLSRFQLELRDQIGQSSANAGLPTHCAELWLEEFLLPSLPTQIRMLHKCSWRSINCRSFPTHGVSTVMVNIGTQQSLSQLWKMRLPYCTPYLHCLVVTSSLSVARRCKACQRHPNAAHGAAAREDHHVAPADRGIWRRTRRN